MVTPRKRELLDGLLVLLKAKTPLESEIISMVPGGDFGDQGEKLGELHRRMAQKAQQDALDQQIGMLSESRIPLGPATRVGVGAVVTFRSGRGMVRTSFILPTAGGEVLSQGVSVMTPNTPPAKALEGRRAGETVHAKTPAGLQAVEILSVE